MELANINYPDADQLLYLNIVENIRIIQNF
jgi:hypothetical protein